MPNDDQTINSMPLKKSARGSAVKPFASNKQTLKPPQQNTRQLRSHTKESDQAQRQLQSNPPLLDLEGILRKTRKRRESTQAQDQPESPTTTVLLRSLSIRKHLFRHRKQIHRQNLIAAGVYLPPLDDEALTIINAIIANPDMGKEFPNIRPDHKDFSTGLEHRNVFLKETAARDPQADHIKSLASGEPFQETDKEKEFHDELWALDQAKCNDGSNEAVFQRTVMMNLITRYHLIYNRRAKYPHVLDFSVEEPWTCPPMPTRAYWKKEGGYLTQPKPDLAVCFRREALIPRGLWENMPLATKSLACYENTNDAGKTRVFHFFTIEGEKATFSITNDTVGKRQSLNNASQSLHNMYEFFKDAGRKHEKEFFAKVRYFSVVASTEGLHIRIHRATREPSRIMPERPDYPLRFEYQEFISIQRDEFNRERVFEIFEKILISYGAKELYLLLQNAAKALIQKLLKDPAQMGLRSNPDFYRYGQTDINLRSRIQTPAASLPPSIKSVQMIDRTETPATSSPQTPVETQGAQNKRTRAQSTEDKPAKCPYQQKKTTNP